jgi:small neutral amino acid transporter SnatA (MarC family)
LPLLGGPGPIAVVAALAARRGRGDVAIAVAVAVALAAVSTYVAATQPRDQPSLVERVVGRFVGAAMVLVAFTLIVDGVLGV